MINVLALFKAPAPYFSPLFKMFSELSDINLKVVYCIKTTEDGYNYIDIESGNKRNWGINVLEGHEYIFLDNILKPCGVQEYKIINRKIRDVIKDGNYDVILLGTSYWSLVTWYLIHEAKKKNIPIITRATIQTKRNRSNILLAFKKIIVGLYCKKMCAGVYECKDQRDYLLYYGMKEESLFYSPCAVNNAFFRGLALKNNKFDLRHSLEICEDTTVIVTTGRMVPIKRPWDLIHAYEILIQENYKIELFIVGDGPLKEEIESYIKFNNLSGIHCTGNVTQIEVSKYLSISDIFILPSESDASPKSLNEAMNFELPIVITDGVSTANELLKEGINGYMYKSGDVKSMVSCIKKIIDNEMASDMGKESLKIITDNGYERVISGWKNAIQYALKMK